jgi:two-component system, response regulator PdtaR
MALPSLAARPRNSTVLVVEDDVLVRITLADALRRQGLDTIEAASAGEALRVLSRCGHVDLLLTDVELQNSYMDGLALATTIHECHPDIRIVVTSGQRPEQLPDGTAAFFPKPYSLPAIVDCVKELVEH